MQVPRRGTRSGADSQVRGENCYNRVMGAGSMPEVGRGVQLQRAIFVSYCQKEGGGKPAFKINLTPMRVIHTNGEVVECGILIQIVDPN